MAMDNLTPRLKANASLVVIVFVVVVVVVVETLDTEGGLKSVACCAGREVCRVWEYHGPAGGERSRKNYRRNPCVSARPSCESFSRSPV